MRYDLPIIGLVCLHKDLIGIFNTTCVREVYRVNVQLKPLGTCMLYVVRDLKKAFINWLNGKFHRTGLYQLSPYINMISI